MSAMFYEKKVRSFSELKKELSRLDSDSGIRLVCSYMRRPSFAFVTRFGTRYTLMVYGRRGGRTPTAGELILAREFGSPEELESFLSGMVPKKLEGYVY